MYYFPMSIRFLGKCEQRSRGICDCLVPRVLPNNSRQGQGTAPPSGHHVRQQAPVPPLRKSLSERSLRLRGRPVCHRGRGNSRPKAIQSHFPCSTREDVGQGTGAHPACWGLRHTQDIPRIRAMVSTSGTLPRTTSMSTSPPTRLDRPST